MDSLKNFSNRFGEGDSPEASVKSTTSQTTSQCELNKEDIEKVSANVLGHYTPPGSENSASDEESRSSSESQNSRSNSGTSTDPETQSTASRDSQKSRSNSDISMGPESQSTARRDSQNSSIIQASLERSVDSVHNVRTVTNTAPAARQEIFASDFEKIEMLTHAIKNRTMNGFKTGSLLENNARLIVHDNSGRDVCSFRIKTKVRTTQSLRDIMYRKKCSVWLTTTAKGEDDRVLSPLKQHAASSIDSAGVTLLISDLIKLEKLTGKIVKIYVQVSVAMEDDAAYIQEYEHAVALEE